MQIERVGLIQERSRLRGEGIKRWIAGRRMEDVGWVGSKVNCDYEVDDGKQRTPSSTYIPS